MAAARNDVTAKVKSLRPPPIPVLDQRRSRLWDVGEALLTGAIVTLALLALFAATHAHP
jgi:hypothetical protein